MRRSPTQHLALVADDVLNEVERVERVKEAEVAAVRAATPRHQGDLGQLLCKLAEEVRAIPEDVTYDDLRAYSEGRL